MTCDQLSSVCKHKMGIFSKAHGFEPMGVIYARANPFSGKPERVSVDNFGRVQWWDIDGSGKMIPMEGK